MAAPVILAIKAALTPLTLFSKQVRQLQRFRSQLIKILLVIMEARIDTASKTAHHGSIYFQDRVQSYWIYELGSGYE